MVLVDTSIWIDYLGPRPGRGAARLDAVIAADEPFALTPVVLQEVLQGARSTAELRRLRRTLLTQNMLLPGDPVQSHVSAAAIYAQCRWAGVTPRSTLDCLIAQVAIEHRARLLHNDADFDRIATVVAQLMIY